MYCTKCNNDLINCTCSDLEEKAAMLVKSPHILCRVCEKCEKHYAVCKCEDPVWTTSDKLTQPAQTG